MGKRRQAWSALMGGALLLVLAASTQATDWNAWTDTDTVVVISRNEDGSLRETTVWLVVVDGQGYIRTGDTRWGANVERDPDIVLRVEGKDLPLRADFVTDAPLREKVEAAFAEKYGWSDSLIGYFRGDDPKIMRLLPRPVSPDA